MANQLASVQLSESAPPSAAVLPSRDGSRAARYVRLFLVGVCLPGLVSFVDRLILGRLSQPNSATYEAVIAFGIYAGQLALISWAIARYIDAWVLRWFLWVWAMALVDLQLSVLSAADSHATPAIRCLSTGVLAAQIGALVVWGILGTGAVAWRIPSLLVCLIVAWNAYLVLIRISSQGSAWYQLGWDDLLWVQAMILSALCGMLRIRGVTIAKSTGDVPATSTSRADGRSMQFGIRDVLIGTTCLAGVLGLAKAGDLLTWQFLQGSYNTGFFFVGLAAVCTAIVLLVALWASLGRGPSASRVLVLVLASLALGAPIAWYCLHTLRVGQAQPLLLWNNRLYHWYSTGYWWIGWMFLAGTLLASLLVTFRALDYRLVKGPTLLSRRPR